MQRSTSAFNMRHTSKPEKFGHIHIEQNQVGLLLPGQFNSGEAPVRADNFELFLRQSHAGDCQIVRAVVDNEDLHRVSPVRRCPYHTIG